ncbi:hypothetical protein GF322_00190 [Candidatus Dependentiae bacterium]|nr:hypothetical protein [Candidatus Dependentiae bacterium]
MIRVFSIKFALEKAKLGDFRKNYFKLMDSDMSFACKFFANCIDNNSLGLSVKGGFGLFYFGLNCLVYNSKEKIFKLCDEIIKSINLSYANFSGVTYYDILGIDVKCI